MIEEYKIQKGTLTAIADKFRDILRSFKEDIGANGLFNSDAVTVYYIEYVDFSEEYDTLSPVKAMSDKFVAYDFIEDNNGKVTPVIYRIDSESERYADIIDYGEPYFYIDQAEIDGVLYDKWRKIEPGNENFGWDGSSKKYIYTNVLLNNDKYSPTNFPAKISEVYNAGYNSGLGTLIKVDELPNSGVKENTVYSYNGALYIYVDGEWIDYIVTSGSLDITENGAYDVASYANVEVNVPNIITVTSLPTTDIDANALYRYNGMFYQWVDEDDSIAGTWVFKTNDLTTLERNDKVYYDLDFVAGGTRFTYIQNKSDYAYGRNSLYYNDTLVWQYTTDLYDDHWRSGTKYKTIEISSTVVKRRHTDGSIGDYTMEFRTWLKANATKTVNGVPSGWVRYLAPEGSTTITTNGTVNVADKVEVVVNVPIPSGYIKPSGTATITTNNSTTDITSYASVKVAISEYKGTVVIE